ncbi:CocE/NonD family hydrolase C-terminal non-catalytic domain-containing protein [Actinomadura rubrisoli]|nr:CocE/NonD family hydrolase C-terminal non-catalytic domain-containing protein [Actinomadura rubrisoli]
MDRPAVRYFVGLSLVPGPQSDAARPIRVTQGWLRASHRAELPELTSPLRPFHAHTRADPVEPGTVYRLRVELLPMSFLARRGDRIRLQISNHDSLIADAPMTHFYGQKTGTDTYHHDPAHSSGLRLQERPR